jgi:hypothetical protein
VTSAVLVLLSATLLMGMATSAIRGDEVMVFHPTVGYRSGDGWTLPIRGVIYWPKDDSRLRAATIGLFRRLFGVRQGEGGEVFSERARPFLVDNQRGKAISIRLGNKDHPVGQSGANGHFRGTIRLGREEVAALDRGAGVQNGWVIFQAVTPPGDDRVFPGKVGLLAETGIFVISDVDDTVKVSQVRDRRELLANTFLREFRGVPGMAEAYRKWAADGAAFHYVSASPWQLYDPLARFLAVEGFPEGSFAMMNVGKAMQHRKSSPEGRRERLWLLRPHFPDAEEHLSSIAGAITDLIDAYVLLWTARRILRQEALVFSPNPETDARGLRAEIVA